VLDKQAVVLETIERQHYAILPLRVKLARADFGAGPHGPTVSDAPPFLPKPEVERNFVLSQSHSVRSGV
jgi:hypothetical protein